MPWPNDIDGTRPTDLEFVSEGAERFRELKLALIDRFSTAFKGFPDEDPDNPGVNLLFPIASVRVGTEAEKPEVPEREGAGWFSTDNGILWVGNDELQWQQASTPVGTDDDAEKTKTGVAFAGNMTLRAGQNFNNANTFLTQVDGFNFYPDIFWIRMRQFSNPSAPGEWSKFWTSEGFGHSHLTNADGGGLFNFVIPDTTVGIYVGTSFFLSDEGKLGFVPRIVQGHAAGVADDIFVQGVAQFRRYSGVDIRDVPTVTG